MDRQALISDQDAEASTVHASDRRANTSKSSLISHLRSINRYNLATLRKQPLSEISGCLGDLGTLLPLMIAMSIQGSIDLGSTLVFSGLTNIFTGSFYGMPIAVQPMKAIASAAISQKFSPDETAAAGLTVSIAVLVLSVSGLLYWLNRWIPVPIVKGIQVGAGLNLVINAGTSLKTVAWAQHALDNRIWAIAAFLFLLLATVQPRIPYALLVFLLGLLFAIVSFPGYSDTDGIFFWRPTLSFPSGSSWAFGALNGALPQLPLTLLNSIIAVVSLSATLFPDYPPTPSTTSIGLSVAVANLIGCWFHAMPICHGSGGLAGQYRFGARSGSSIIILGLVKLFLGLFVGQAVIPILQKFPVSLLGVMVLAAGVELAKVGKNVSDLSDIWNRAEAEANAQGRPISAEKRKECERQGQDRWMVMLITAAGCIGFKNDAVGFIAGLIWHFGLRLPETYEKWNSRRQSHGQIRLGDNVDGRGNEA